MAAEVLVEEVLDGVIDGHFGCGCGEAVGFFGGEEEFDGFAPREGGGRKPPVSKL